MGRIATSLSPTYSDVDIYYIILGCDGVTGVGVCEGVGGGGHGGWFGLGKNFTSFLWLPTATVTAETPNSTPIQVTSIAIRAIFFMPKLAMSLRGTGALSNQHFKVNTLFLS
ncbi:hypothetical protein DPMN_173632 [Dreissena polymorpha]|uniref:Uncharacterized protein n=1 Tax=Dreissena polymorpha TaxID=45954 RepID=A0A9D4IGA1_DREPO|nr:hypothetical protein DPMN_173632 [Dreissena polymorpha]